MVGHPKHVPKALAQGVDIICAQGGEGGGHTGDTPFSILIPAVVDLCRTSLSPLTGKPVLVVAAGGIADGRGLAASLSYGASGVWVGTRFVASVEAGAPERHKKELLEADYDGTVRTLVYSGRPMSVRKTEYVREWEEKRQHEILELTGKGRVPHEVELEKKPERSAEGRSCTCTSYFYERGRLILVYRAYGEGRRFHPRYQACKGDVSGCNDWTQGND